MLSDVQPKKYGLDYFFFTVLSPPCNHSKGVMIQPHHLFS